MLYTLCTYVQFMPAPCMPHRGKEFRLSRIPLQSISLLLSHFYEKQPLGRAENNPPNWALAKLTPRTHAEPEPEPSAIYASSAAPRADPSQVRGKGDAWQTPPSSDVAHLAKNNQIPYKHTLSLSPPLPPSPTKENRRISLSPSPPPSLSQRTAEPPPLG